MKLWKSIMSLLALLLIISFPTETWAHSKLQSSLPAADSTSTQPVQEISLNFNEKIDSTLSTLTITNDKGEKIGNTKISVEDSVLKAKLESALASGTYKVEWKIVGADGHPIKGDYVINVEAPEGAAAETPADGQDQASEGAGEEQIAGDGQESNSSVDDTDKPSEPSAAEPNNSPTDNEQTQLPTQANESNSNTWLWVGIIVILVVIGGGIAFIQSRKRR